MESDGERSAQVAPAGASKGRESNLVAKALRSPIFRRSTLVVLDGTLYNMTKGRDARSPPVGDAQLAGKVQLSLAQPRIHRP